MALGSLQSLVNNSGLC